jgi:hypothetical protein
MAQRRLTTKFQGEMSDSGVQLSIAAARKSAAVDHVLTKAICKSYVAQYSPSEHDR